MGFGFTKSLCISLIAVFAVGCTKAIPEFEDISSILSGPNITDSEGNVIDEIVIFSPTESFTIQGTCNPLYLLLLWRPQGESEYSAILGSGAIDSASSDLDCSDGVFTIAIPDASVLFGSLSVNDERVLAIKGENNGQYSDSTDLKVIYLDPNAPSPDPENILILDNGGNYLELDWDSGGGSTQGFRIAYNMGPVAPASCTSGTAISEGSVSGTSHTVSGLTDNTQYSFRICSINGVPAESAGATITVTTSDIDSPPVVTSFVAPAFAEDTSTSIALTLNSEYTDTDGDGATSCAVSNVTSGFSVTCGSCDPGSSNSCQINVIPPADFNGGYSFDYTVTSNGLTSNVGNITGTVSSVPDVTQVRASTSSGTFGLGVTIYIYVDFDENIDVTGTPSITLETGLTDRAVNYTTYAGSTLTFPYTVQSNDTSVDLDYVSVNAIDLNGGSIYQQGGGYSADIALPMPGAANSLGDYANIAIDGVLPTVSIDSPNDGHLVNQANQSSVSVSGSCSENARSINIISGGTSSAITCVEGSWSAVVDMSAETDSSAVVFSVSHSDLAGNSSSDSITIDKDTQPPVVALDSLPAIDASNKSSITVSGSCTDGEGLVTLSGDFPASPVTTSCGSSIFSESIDFKLQADGVINLSASQADPNGNEGSDAISLTKDTSVKISLTITSRTDTESNLAGELLQITASLDVNSDTDVSFDYSMDPLATADDGVDYTGFTDNTTVTIPGGSGTGTFNVLSIGNNDAVVEGDETIIINISNPNSSFDSVSIDELADQYILTINEDDSAPTISSVPSPLAGTYYSGHYIYFTVNYDEAVIYSGSPRIQLNVSGSTKYASILNGNNTSTLRFGYLVERGFEDGDGITLGSSIDLNGGSIVDVDGGNDAALSFTAPSGVSVLTADNPIPQFNPPTCIVSAIVGDNYECDVPNNSGTDYINVADSSPGSQADTQIWTTSGNCSWLSFDSTPSNLRVSGIPGPTDVGNCTMTLSLSDGATTEHGSTSYSIYVRVYEDRSGQIGGLGGGGGHTCAIIDDGLKCWGYNHVGQLGTGSNSPIQEERAVTVSSLAPGNTSFLVKKMSGGVNFSCALGYDVGASQDQVKCWGDNTNGELGIGFISGMYFSPMDINFYDPVLDIATGANHSCIISRYVSDRNLDGAVYCWGNGVSGRLGDNLAVSSGSPVQVIKDSDGSPLVGAIDISAGYDHSCAVIKDGTVYCWGDGQYGQLGQENGLDHLKAVQVLGIGRGSNPRGVSVELGFANTCVRLSDGNVKCFGRNNFGQILAGAVNFYGNSSGQIVNGSNELVTLLNYGTAGTPQHIQIGPAGGYVCNFFSGTDLRCFGAGMQGQLGRESASDFGDGGGEMDIGLLSPIDFGTGTIIDIGTSRTSVCVLVEDFSREVRCWGHNIYGQLGIGTSGNNIGDEPGEMGSALVSVMGLGPGGGGSPTMLDSAWNSNGLTYYNGDLGVTSTVTALRAVRGMDSKSSGKWYFEVQMVSLPMAVDFQSVGLAFMSASTTNYLGADSNSIGCSGSGSCYSVGTPVGSISGFMSGDVLSVAVDVDAGKMWYKINGGSWQGGGSPATGGLPTVTFLGGTVVFPAANTRYSGDDMLFNFGSPWNYAPPLGYSGWTSGP